MIEIPAKRAAMAKLKVIQNDCSKTINAGLKGQWRSCQAGCAACCKQWIGVYWLEAKAMLLESRRVGFVIDEEKLRRESETLLHGVRKEDWKEPCTFLRPDNRCAVYARRPMQCRALVVRSDPALCHTPGAKVSRYDTWPAVEHAYRRVRVEHVKEAITDMIAPIPLMVDLAMRGKTPSDVAEYINPQTGILGLVGDPNQDREKDSSNRIVTAA